MTMNFFKEEKRMKIKKLGIIAAAAIMGISVAAPATNVQASPYSDAFWSSFNGYLAGRAVNINDWDYGNLSDGNVEVKTKTGVTYVGDVVIPNTADLSYAFASSGTLQKLDVGALNTTGVDRIAQTFAMDHNLVEIDGWAKLLLAETPVTPAQPITAPVKPENKPNKTKDNGQATRRKCNQQTW